MNNENKISLTIIVEGSTMHSNGIKKIPYVVTKQDLTTKKLPPKIGSKVVRKGIINVVGYSTVDAKIHLNLTREAYDYYISGDKPTDYPKKDWKRLSNKEKLDFHMASLARAKNGKAFSYVVLED